MGEDSPEVNGQTTPPSAPQEGHDAAAKSDFSGYRPDYDAYGKVDNSFFRRFLGEKGVNVETFMNALRGSSEKVSRYINTRQVGLDGQPLPLDEAQMELFDVEIKRRKDRMVALMAMGQPVPQEDAMDTKVLESGLAQAKADKSQGMTFDPERLSAFTQEHLLQALRLDVGYRESSGNQEMHDSTAKPDFSGLREGSNPSSPANESVPTPPSTNTAGPAGPSGNPA